MSQPSKTVMLAILAAGQSRRFGDKDKLASQLSGKRLGLHSAECWVRDHFDYRTIIAARPDHPCAAGWQAMGYDIAINALSEEGQAASVRLAAQLAVERNVDALCIALADMPFVSVEHQSRLIETYQNSRPARVVASASDRKPMPPALFPRSAFPLLQKLSGDQGARTLLETAVLVPADARCLQDIDTPDALAEADRQGRSDG